MADFILGTGFFAKPENEVAKKEMLRLWIANNGTNAQVWVYDNCTYDTGVEYPATYQVVRTRYNLGHVSNMSSDPATYSGLLCGWAHSVLTLAMIAYGCNKDLVFKEQDCFAFGDWVGQMYRDCEDRKMVFGKCRLMLVEQSLFLVKHGYLLDFIRRYLAFNERDSDMLPEFKFKALMDQDPGNIGYLSFGYGRDRPVNFSDPAFYFQQPDPDEVCHLRKLLS